MYQTLLDAVTQALEGIETAWSTVRQSYEQARVAGNPVGVNHHALDAAYLKLEHAYAALGAYQHQHPKGDSNPNEHEVEHGENPLRGGR